MGTFRMPSLGADMEHGTIVEWRVRPGDPVARGQIVAVVDTEKADIEIEVFETGTVGEILVDEGIEVAVGTPLATIVAVGTPTVPAPPAPRAEPPHAEAADATIMTTPAAPDPHHAARVRSPLVRRLAEELHVDLARLEPTAPDGVVHREDVERAARHAPVPDAAAPVPAVPATVRAGAGAGAGAGRVPASPLARRLAATRGIDLTTIVPSHADGALHAADVERARPATPRARRETDAGRGQDAVARLMARSKREIPHYYLTHEIDLENALVWCEQRNAERPVDQRVLPAALLLRAVVLACVAVPDCNGHFVDERFVPAPHVDLAIAVSAREGSLLAPVVPAAETLTLDDLMAAMRDLVARARSRALRAADATPASITVTSLGDQGVDVVHGVIVPPQVAIVGFGAVGARPRVHEGMIVARRIVTATLSADHRVSHGHRGSRFLRAIAGVLERPEQLA